MRDKLTLILRSTDEDISMYELAKQLNTTGETIRILTNEASKTYVDIARKDFPHVMKTTDETLLEVFFQREDVDFCFLCMNRIKDIKDHMRNKNTFGMKWLTEKWEEYRGY